MLSDNDPAPRLPTSRGERLWLALFGAGFLGLIAADLAQGFSVRRLSVLFVLVAWVPLLVLHELGHALAARAVGWHVTEVVIGFGRELLRFRIGETRVRVRAVPIEGYVIPSPNSVRGARLKQAWIYFSGPLADLLVLGSIAWILDFEAPGQSDSLGRLVLESIAVTAAIGALCTLTPYRSGGNPSDGLGMLTSWLHSDERFQERLCAPFISEGRRLLLREQTEQAHSVVQKGLEQHPDEARLKGLLGVCQAARGNSTEAFATLESLGPPEARPDALCAEQLGNAAWAVLFLGDAELMVEAQRALQRALELTPRDPHLEILLGRIHLERGRAEEAYRCLMEAYKQTRDADQEAQCVAYLALACAALEPTPARPRVEDYAARFARAVEAHDVPPGLHDRVRQLTRKS
jgi:Flp pilus assembly protein TadD